MTFVRGHLGWDGSQLSTVEGYGRYVDRPCLPRYFEQQLERNKLATQQPMQWKRPMRS